MPIDSIYKGAFKPYNDYNKDAFRLDYQGATPQPELIVFTVYNVHSMF